MKPMSPIDMENSKEVIPEGKGQKRALTIVVALGVVAQIFLAAYVILTNMEKENTESKQRASVAPVNALTSIPSAKIVPPSADASASSTGIGSPLGKQYWFTLVHAPVVDAAEWHVEPEFYRCLLQRDNLNFNSFEASNSVDDTVVSYLKRFPIEHLILNDTHVTRKSIPVLANMQSLVELDVSYMSLTADDLKLLMRLKRLQELGASQCGLNDESMRVLGSRKFTSLVLNRNPEIGDAGAAYIRNSGATKISLSKTSITDIGVSQLPITCKELILSENHITDKSLPYIARMKDLVALNLSNTLITDKGLRAFNPPPALSALFVRYCPMKIGTLREFQYRHPKCHIATDLPGLLEGEE